MEGGGTGWAEHGAHRRGARAAAWPSRAHAATHLPSLAPTCPPPALNRASPRPVVVPALSTELRALARAAESMGAFLRGAVRAGYDVCSRGLSVRELLEQAAQSVGSAEPCWQIWHDGQRIGALWAQPGCFRTPQLTAPLPGSVARGGRVPTTSPVTMSLYVDARAQMGERARRPSGRLGELPNTGS